MNKTWWVVIAIVVVVLLYGWSAYNGFVTKNEAVDGQWAQVETAYQRRFDLIPNLVESVKGIFGQEQAIFNALAEARTRYSGARTVDEKAAAATQVESALGRLLVVVENYPNLRSAEAVTNLMTQLEGTENRVSVERRRFNDSVRELNVAVKRFPGNVVASIFGFDERTYFEAAEGAAEAPRVEF
ncbi:MAG: LemA family protein [Candidatus Jorgensenbacteria bacterium]|nr:LemA family protein [Candidatus Jorgensenbacteria bacterium]